MIDKQQATAGKQKLLYLVHRLPYPPNKGDKIASFNLLRFLARRYDVYLGTLVDDPADLDPRLLDGLAADGLSPGLARLQVPAEGACPLGDAHRQVNRKRASISRNWGSFCSAAKKQAKVD